MIAVKVGAAFTLKPPGSVAVAPPGNVTVTSLAPTAAPPVIVIDMEMLVGVTVPRDAVTPVPLKFTPVAPVRFVPVSVALRFVAP